MTELAVIMSIYNQDKLPFVRESVESILAQTFSDFHYFLIFDGPVPTEIEQYITGITDDRIRLYRLEQNCGLAVALNTLLEVVLKNPDYKYIARMDADDISLNERFEKQRQYLTNNPDINILGTWYEEIDKTGRHLAFRKPPCEHEKLRRRFLFRTPFAHSSVMFRRNLFDVAGFYPLNTYMMEDNYLWGIALVHGLRFSNIGSYMLKFRVDKDFYKRRFGFKYGSNYIKTKFRINRLLRVSPIYYFVSVFIGLFRMLPPSIIKSFSRI
ncbi:MAG: glycosyltransferase [Methanococcaceae archaeon]